MIAMHQLNQRGICRTPITQQRWRNWKTVARSNRCRTQQPKRVLSNEPTLIYDLH